MTAANRRLTVLQQHLAQGEYGVSSDTLDMNPTRAEPSVWSHVPQASTVRLSVSKSLDCLVTARFRLIVNIAVCRRLLTLSLVLLKPSRLTTIPRSLILV